MRQKLKGKTDNIFRESNSQITEFRNIRNQRGNIISDPTDIRRI